VDTKRKIPKFFIKKGDTRSKKFRNAWHLVVKSLGIDIEMLVRGDSAP